MGILGFHLTVSVIATLVLQKIIVYFPVVNGLLSGLMLWTVPNNSYLSEFVQLALGSVNSSSSSSSSGSSNGSGKNGSGKSRAPRKNAADKRHHNHQQQQAAVSAEKGVDLPKELPLPLIPVTLTPKDVGVLLYFDDLLSILNMAAVVGVVFVASEVFQGFWPDHWQSDINFTIIWLCLVLFSSLRILVTLTWLVVAKQSQDSAERTLIALASLCFFVLAIAMLILDGSWLDLKLDEGLSKLFDVDVAGRKLRRKNSSLVFVLKTSLCVFAALFASTLLFPALRLARSYLGAMKRSGLLERILFQVSFVCPVLLLLLWVPPLSTGVLFPQDSEPLIPGFTLAQYQHVRLLLVLLFCVLRMLMARPHLQQYLHSAHGRVESERRKAARFTSSKFSDTVRTVNGGLAVVSLQYLCPVIILLACVLLLHSLGNYSWTGEYLAEVTPVAPNPRDLRLMSRLPSLLASLLPTAFLSGVLSFWTVWLLVSISVSTCLGFLYANFIER